jgi:hypothetical protein
VTKPEGARNGHSRPMVTGSALSQDAIVILLSLTPTELRALNRHVRSMCLYGGREERAAMLGAAKLNRAAEVA